MDEGISQRIDQGVDHVVVEDIEGILDAVAAQSVQTEAMLFLDPEACGQFTRHCRSLRIDEIAGLRDAEIDDGNREHGQADVAQAAAAGDADSGVIGCAHFAEDDRQPFLDGFGIVAQVGQDLANRSFVIGDGFRRPV